MLAGVPREMEIIDGLIEIAEKDADFYNIGGMPLKEIFTDIKNKLAAELRVTQEQANLARAADYFRGHKMVRVPKLYTGISTQTVTFMDFLHGEKINEAFPGDNAKRAELARRLMRVMTYETLFSKPPTALFRGDPHAGNVMHLVDDPTDPFKIGLLDWGLLGEFERPQRMKMVQLSMALDRRSRKKLHNNVGALLRGAYRRTRSSERGSSPSPTGCCRRRVRTRKSTPSWSRPSRGTVSCWTITLSSTSRAN